MSINLSLPTYPRVHERFRALLHSLASGLLLVLPGILTLFGALSDAIVTGLAFADIFPGLGLPLAVIVGISGAFTEGAVLWEGTRHHLRTFLVCDFFNQLKQHMQHRYVLNQVLAEKAFSSQIERHEYIKTFRVQDHREQHQKIQGLFDGLGLYPPHSGPKRALWFEWRTKQVLLCFSILFSAGNALGFGAIAYTATFTTLMGMGFVVGAVYPLALLSGVIGGIVWGLVMYDFLFCAITDNLHLKLKRFLKRLSPCQFRSGDSRCVSVLKFLIRLLVLALIVFFMMNCVLATLGTAGAWLHATILCLSHMGIFSTAGVTALGETIIYVFVVPVFFLFSVKNILSLFEFGLDYCEHGPWWRFSGRSPNILKYASLLVATVLFIFHAIGSGAVAGQGVNDPQDKFMHIFHGVTYLLNWMGVKMQAVTLAVISATSIEFADLPFVTGIQPLSADEVHNHALIPELVDVLYTQCVDTTPEDPAVQIHVCAHHAHA